MIKEVESDWKKNLLIFFQKPRLQILLLVAVCVVLYARALGYDYVWDDVIIFLSSNSLLVEPLSWSLLTTPILPDTSYMRPLVMLTWWLEFNLFGQSSFLSHGVNVLIYVLNVILVRGIAVSLLKEISFSQKQTSPWMPLAVALLYAIHPALIESTAWVSGRFDLLCTTGVLGASYVFLTLKAGYTRTVWILLLTTVALMSKELGVIAPAVLFCLWMGTFYPAQGNIYERILKCFNSDRKLWLLLILLLIFYFVLRRWSIGGIYHETLNNKSPSFLNNYLLPLETLYFYLKIVFYPLPFIDTFYPMRKGPLSFFDILGMAATAAVMAYVFWAAIKRQRSWAWLMLAALVSIVLVLHFIPMTIAGNIAQDRFLTLPLSFFLIALGLLPWGSFFNSFSKGIFIRRISTLSLIAFYLLLVSITISALPKWQSDLVLWARAYQVAPQQESVRLSFIDASLKANRLDIAKNELDNIRIKNGSFTAKEQLRYAGLLLAQGNPEAILYYEGLAKNMVIKEGAKFNTVALKREVEGQLARAKMIFEGDLNSAFIHIQAAEKLTSSAHRHYVLYVKAGILLAKDRWEQGQELLQALRNEYHSDSAGLEANMWADIKRYCALMSKQASPLPRVCSTR